MLWSLPLSLEKFTFTIFDPWRFFVFSVESDLWRLVFYLIQWTFYELLLA